MYDVAARLINPATDERMQVSYARPGRSCRQGFLRMHAFACQPASLPACVPVTTTACIVDRTVVGRLGIHLGTSNQCSSTMTWIPVPLKASLRQSKACRRRKCICYWILLRFNSARAAGASGRILGSAARLHSICHQHFEA